MGEWVYERRSLDTWMSGSVDKCEDVWMCGWVAVCICGYVDGLMG